MASKKRSRTARPRKKQPPARRIPLGLKVFYTAFMLFWIPTVWRFYGPDNFLWICDLGNLVLLVALWTESRLLFSSQAVSLLPIDLLWIVDLGTALLTGSHPIGGTQYMFESMIPVHVRLASLYHVLAPVLIVVGLRARGYSSWGLLLQTALTWILLPLSFVFSTPEGGINWVFGPFGQTQTFLDPRLYLLLCMVVYPAVLYLPAHAVILGLRRIVARA